MSLPAHWTEQDWLAFVLLTAAHADGVFSNPEIRLIEVRLGNERLAEVAAFRESLDDAARLEVIRLGIKAHITNQDAYTRFNKILMHLFLADGEYSQEEQKLVQQIKAWMRES